MSEQLEVLIQTTLNLSEHRQRVVAKQFRILWVVRFYIYFFSHQVQSPCILLYLSSESFINVLVLVLLLNALHRLLFLLGLVDPPSVGLLICFQDSHLSEVLSFSFLFKDLFSLQLLLTFLHPLNFKQIFFFES
jgi:hypothetical protein